MTAIYRGRTHAGKVESTEDGKLAYVLEDGPRFKSRWAPGSAVMSGIACNGWRFWSVEGSAGRRGDGG